MKLLEEKGRMYGYEITKEVERLIEGNVQLTWGALYPTLHKLEADHLITVQKVNIGKRVRKYYTLTESGRSTAREKVQKFRNSTGRSRSRNSLTTFAAMWRRRWERDRNSSRPLIRS